jgi:hypothetical protein
MKMNYEGYGEEMNFLSVDSEEGLEPESKIYCLDCLDKDGAPEHEVFVTIHRMTTMYKPEEIGQVLHATIVLQLTMESKRKKY